MTTYAPDLAPDLEPKVVRWLPPHRTGVHDHGGYLSWTGLAVAVVAVAALAAGAAAVAALVLDDRPERDRFRLLGVERLRLKRRPF